MRNVQQSSTNITIYLTPYKISVTECGQTDAPTGLATLFIIARVLKEQSAKNTLFERLVAALLVLKLSLKLYKSQ